MTNRLLIANSNTSAQITDRMVHVARRAAMFASIEGATVAFGPAVIQTAEEARVASAATLELLEQRRGTFDAAIIASFADAGLDKARVRHDRPILGLGHASLLTAVACAGRVAVLTGAGSIAVLTRSLIERYDLAASVPVVLEVQVPLPQLAFADTATFEDIQDVITRAVSMHAIRAVLLGGAFLVGLAERIRVPVPVYDPIVLAVACAEASLRDARAAINVSQP